jgi:hypothetical protein
MALGLLPGTLVARLGHTGGWGRKFGQAAAALAIIGASLDVVENLVSFVMLMRPDAIAQPQALACSSAAAARFGLLTLAMAALLVALPTGLWSRTRHAGPRVPPREGRSAGDGLANVAVGIRRIGGRDAGKAAQDEVGHMIAHAGG